MRLKQYCRVQQKNMFGDATMRNVYLKIVKIGMLMLLILSVGTTAVQSQSIFQGPAFGSVAGGAVVSTDALKSQPETIVPVSRKRILNPFWDKFDRPLLDDRFNNTPPSAPLGSNVFIDAGVDKGARSEAFPPKIMIDFEGPAETNSIPPDPTLAVGPNHIIAMVNTEFIFYDKQGNQLFKRTADTWFQNVLPYSGLFDPIVVYDNIDNRWIMCWDLQSDDNQNGFWLLSISDDDDPMGNWCNYSFPAHLNGDVNAGNWGDYQKVGYDDQAVYITGRQFAFNGNGFQYSKLRILPKTQLYANDCGQVDYTDFWSFRDPNNVGAVVDGPPIVASHLEPTGNNTTYMVVDAPYITSTFITLWKLQDATGANPTLTAVNIPTTAAAQPPDANQLGGGSPRINSGRRSYRNAVYTNGQLWTATAVAGGQGNNYSFIRYLKIDLAAETAVEDVTFGANGFFYMYPAIMVDEDENVVIGFTRSGDNEYAGAAYTGRRSFDTPGLAPSALLKAGEANYVKTFGGARNRWGDYMGIALDPQHPSVIWTLVEYATSPANTWANRIGAFTFKHAVFGTITEQATGLPLEGVALKVVESGQTVISDSTGEFSFGIPVKTVTFQASKFEFTSIDTTVTVQPYFPQQVDFSMAPAIQAAFTGQVQDPTSGQGIPAVLEFFHRDNPNPGPYVTASTDSSGFFDITTIVGVYDIAVHPAAPYPFTEVDSVELIPGGTAHNIELPTKADVFIVDDDDSSTYESYYIDAVLADTLTYNLWETQTQGTPSVSVMTKFPRGIVIWFTGDSDSNSIDSTEATELLAHLNNGGKLFISGQDIIEENDSTDILNTLGIGFVQNVNSPVVRGESGSIIGNGLILVTGAGAAGNQTSRDQMVIVDSATTAQEFRYSSGATATAGISYQNGQSKAVILGFGFEAITDETRRNTLFQRAIEFLETPVGIADPISDAGVPAKFRLYQNYPNPFNPTTTIRFDVPQQADVRLTIYNTLGQKVRILTDDRYATGTYEILWNGRDEFGNTVTSGIYFYKLEINGQFKDARKLMLLK